MATLLERTIDTYGRHFLLLDLATAAFLTLVLVILLQLPGLPLAIDNSDAGRRSLYTTIATIAGSLMGFVIVAITIALALPDSPGMRLLTTSPHYGEIYDTFLSTICYLGLATGASVVPLVLSLQAPALTYYGYSVLFLVMICVFRLGRCVWILNQLLEVARSETGDD